MQDIGFNEIQEWIDENAIQSYEQITDTENKYRFAVHVADLDAPIYLIKEENEGPVNITARGELGADILSVLMDLDTERRNVQNLFISVLTNAPGEYGYLDDDENPCGFEDVRYISFLYRIYPDGASQHKLMNGITDIRYSILFLQQVIQITRSNLDNRT